MTYTCCWRTLNLTIYTNKLIYLTKLNEFADIFASSSLDSDRDTNKRKKKRKKSSASDSSDSGGERRRKPETKVRKEVAQ